MKTHPHYQEYKKIYENILKERKVSEEARKDIITIHENLQKQFKSIKKRAPKVRKALIVDHLFQNQAKSILQMDFIKMVMFDMKIYAKQMQSRSTQVHKVHDKQVELIQTLMRRFVAGEKVAELVSGSDIKEYK